MKIFCRLTDWLDERTGLKKALVHSATHPVPPGSTWAYVFGTAILTSFIVQVITGMALGTSYTPSAGEAFASLEYISKWAPFGSIVRGMHYWGASAMILFVGMHALRVYLWGSYKFPRELNWLTGVVLLFLTVAMGFTGQILRWDQNAIWTVAVGSQQALRAPFLGKLLVNVFLSGPIIGSSTLGHLFSLHVFVFPALLISIVGLHLWLVLHNGISEPPVAGEPVDPSTYRKNYDEMLKRVGKPFWPDAAWRDITFSTIVVLGILALAIWIGAPELQKPPDPSVVQAEPKPDWYLIWYFAVLALLPHHAEDYVIILLPLLIAVVLFAVPFLSNRGERSIKKRPWAVAVVVMIVTCVGALWLKGVNEVWTPHFWATPIDAQIIGTTTGPIHQGGELFNDKGCLYCHTISGRGGKRGPDLTYVADRLTRDQLMIRIVNGGYNMPSYAHNLSPRELEALVSFLQSRKQH